MHARGPAPKVIMCDHAPGSVDASSSGRCCHRSGLWRINNLMRCGETHTISGHAPEVVRVIAPHILQSIHCCNGHDNAAALRDSATSRSAQVEFTTHARSTRHVPDLLSHSPVSVNIRRAYGEHIIPACRAQCRRHWWEHPQRLTHDAVEIRQRVEFVHARRCGGYSEELCTEL